MTRAGQKLVARRRDELNRDRGSRRLLQVVDARRASSRRATARGRQGDPDAALIAFLLQRLGSATSEVAKGLNLDSGRVSVRLAQLAKAGEVKNTSHGYTIEPGARPGGHERALRRRHQGNEEMLFGVERGGRCGCHGAASSHRASWMFDGVWGEFLRREMMV